MPGPLEGIRVLDLSRVLAGPWCTQILGDFGADVIKVERPGIGDETRQWGPPWVGGETDGTRDAAYYFAANRGKRSITVNLKSEQGREIILALASKSDICIENYKTGKLTEMGLDYQSLKQVRPDIIYCSITGFGQTGPRANQAGYDYLIQAMGGLMSVTGKPDDEPGGGPIRTGVAVTDLTTGMMACNAILAALHHRSQTGEGQYIDLALFDTQISWLANMAMNYLVSGKTPERTGAAHPNLAPYQPFRAADQPVIIAVGNNGQFRRLCMALGLDGLADDPQFRTNADRLVNRKLLVALIEEVSQRQSADELITGLTQAGVSCGPLNNIPEALNDSQVSARDMKITLNHPLVGEIPGIANPVKFSSTKIGYDQAAPPLGWHTDEILSELLELDASQIAALRKNQDV